MLDQIMQYAACIGILVCCVVVIGVVIYFVTSGVANALKVDWKDYEMTVAGNIGGNPVTNTAPWSKGYQCTGKELKREKNKSNDDNDQALSMLENYEEGKSVWDSIDFACFGKNGGEIVMNEGTGVKILTDRVVDE